MTESTEDRYFARVEEHFGRRRGGLAVLSPKDWKLVEKWQNKGIPLPVVLRGINQAFDRFAAAGPRPDRINSLRYCEQEVGTAWEEHRVANVGRSDANEGSGDGLPGAAPHLRNVAEACRRAASDDRPEPVREMLGGLAEKLDALAAAAAAGDVDALSVDDEAATLQAGLVAELEDLTGGTVELGDLGLPPFSPYGL